MPSGGGAVSTVALDLTDRLVLDVRRGIVAQQRGNRPQFERLLEDAHRILSELREVSRPDTAAAAEEFEDVCDLMEESLEDARASQDSRLTSACLVVAADLRRILGTSQS